MLRRDSYRGQRKCRLTIRSTGPIAVGRHLGYKILAQMPAHRNVPVSSNVRRLVAGMRGVARQPAELQKEHGAAFGAARNQTYELQRGAAAVRAELRPAE